MTALNVAIWKPIRVHMGQFGWVIMDGGDQLVRDNLEAEACAEIVRVHNVTVASLQSGIALLEGRLLEQADRKADEVSAMGVQATVQHRLAEMSHLCDHGYILCAPCGFLPPDVRSLWG